MIKTAYSFPGQRSSQRLYRPLTAALTPAGLAGLMQLTFNPFYMETFGIDESKLVLLIGNADF